MVGRHPTQTTLPGDTLKPAWQAACLAYREARQAGQLDHSAWLAARAAVQKICPDLDEPTAGQHAATAINYASVYHAQWFWNGPGKPATRK